MSDIYRKLGSEIGNLVTEKQKQYGDSAGRAGRILAVLYPNGVPLHAYDDALLIVRCLDKFSRIAQRGDDGKDLGGESPWKDIAGYGLLGWQKDEVVESEELPVEVAVDRAHGDRCSVRRVFPPGTPLHEIYNYCDCELAQFRRAMK